MSTLTLTIAVVGVFAIIIAVMFAVEKTSKTVKNSTPEGFFNENPQDVKKRQSLRLPIPFTVFTIVLLLLIKIFRYSETPSSPTVQWGLGALIAVYFIWLGFLYWKKETPTRILLFLLIIPTMLGAVLIF